MRCVINLAIGFILVFLWSCANDPDCNLQVPHNEITIAFYDEETEEEKAVQFDRVKAVASDSLLYDKTDSLHSFSFVLNPAADTVKYYFITGVRRDTIVLSYQRELRWLSESCGPNLSYGHLQLVETTFESVDLLYSQVDFSIDENIRIYN